MATDQNREKTGRRRLAEALEPGEQRLRAAGVAQSLATVTTAAGFFAIAGIAQDVLERDTSWSHDAAWLILLLASAVLRAGCGWAAAELASSGALIAEEQLRKRLLERVFAGAGRHLPSAAQATAVIDEVERIGAYADRYVPAQLATGLVPVLLLIPVFWENWFVGVLLLLCTPLPALNLSIVGMGTAAAAERHAEELRYLSGYFFDRLKGLATLRALGAERAELDRVRVASQRLADSSMAVLRVAFVSAAVLEAIVTVSMAMVALYIGLTLLDYVQVPGLPAHISLHAGLFLLMVTPLYFQPVRSLAAAYHERADALAAIDALMPSLDASPGEERPRTLTSPPRVTISRLSVHFEQRELPALANVSMTVEPGELVGVAGASGAGKSTLLRVIAGDLAPCDGEALVDGLGSVDLAPTAITWLGQSPYLFPGTVAENIALDGSAERTAIVDAAMLAGLGTVLSRLPDGLDTPVGERGWGLSGGEAHRIALARTFLKRARLVLLDEPTAHLDAESEREMIEAIAALARSTTTIVASHSPAVLAACDRVITLDRGELLGPAASTAPALVGASR